MNSHQFIKWLPLLLPLGALILSTLACAERTFTDTRVYAAKPGIANQFYNSVTDRIIEENVWVFRSDGTYSAIINIDGEEITLSGKYGGDDVGDEFFFSIDLNDDGNYDEMIFASYDFTYIEWRRESGALKYFLAK